MYQLWYKKAFKTLQISVYWHIVNRGQGLEGRQTSKAFELINFRCWKGTSRDISGASNSEITIA